LDIYQKTDRINARIRSKKDVSSVLTEISGNNNRTSIFMDSIKRVERFISKVKVILLDKDVEASALATYLEHELDIILKGKKETQLFTRRMQDFYILWFVLNKVNFEMVKHYRIQIKHDLGELFYQMKNIPEQKHIDNRGHSAFLESISEFVKKYSQDERKLKLSDEEKEELFRKQDGKCAISGAPIFLGDDIEVDHEKPIAIGGSDSKENMQIVHRDSNRKKGASYDKG